MKAPLMLAALLLLGWPRAAAAADPPDTRPRESAEERRGVKLRLGVRFALLFRQDEGYFRDARVFAESPSVTTGGAHLANDAIPPAGGVHLEAGIELLPRLSLMGAFHNVTNGVETGDDLKLSLNTRAWTLDVRYALVRLADEASVVVFQVEPLVGGGWYRLKEDFIDRALFDGTLTKTDSSLGARFGLDASVFFAGIGLALGYAYNYAPATVRDKLDGAMHAGGHEINMGLAARF